jgi:multiple antibiotic resistance protein
MDINSFFMFVVALLAIFSPAASISIFATTTKHFPRKTQRKMARHIALIYLGITLVFYIGGQVVLQVLGISIDALQVIGGLLLMIAGIPLCTNMSFPGQNLDNIKDTNWKSIVIVPLTFPITVGGAGLSYVIITAGVINGIADNLIICGGIIVVAIIIWLTYYFAGPISDKLGPGGTDILSKVAGIILMSLGFMILAQGLLSTFPGLAGNKDPAQIQQNSITQPENIKKSN